MPRMVRRAVRLGGHRLRLDFNDGVEGEVDISTLVPFVGVFAPLSEIEFFACVRVDPEAGTLCWPNGADLDPDILYAVATGSPRPSPSEAASGPTAPVPDPGAGTGSPVICRFFGIVVRMSFSDAAAPHFHAEHGDEWATIAIESLAVLEGQLRPRATGLVVEWAILHRVELMKNWERSRRNDPLKEIAPLE